MAQGQPVTILLSYISPSSGLKDVPSPRTAWLLFFPWLFLILYTHTILLRPTVYHLFIFILNVCPSSFSRVYPFLCLPILWIFESRFGHILNAHSRTRVRIQIYKVYPFDHRIRWEKYVCWRRTRYRKKNKTHGILSFSNARLLFSCALSLAYSTHEIVPYRTGLGGTLHVGGQNTWLRVARLR